MKTTAGRQLEAETLTMTLFMLSSVEPVGREVKAYEQTLS